MERSSGSICTDFDGSQLGVFEGIYVSGTQRFEGASGDFFGDFDLENSSIFFAP